MASLAITQPLLGFLSDNPAFFVAHSATRGHIIAFALIVSLVPSVVLGAVMLIMHAISNRAGIRVFYAVMTLLVAVFVLQMVDALPRSEEAISDAGRYVVAMAAAVCLMALYRASRSFRSAVSVLAAFPVVVVLLFLFNSPVGVFMYPPAVNTVALDDLLGEDFTAHAPRHDDAGPANGASQQSVAVLERLNDRLPPIHILVFDELPWASLLDEGGDIDASRYPNFARLGDTSHIFTNVSATAAYSLQSLPAILTGTHQIRDTPRIASYVDSPDNLFTMLGGAYDITAWELVTKLCPQSVCNCVLPSEVADLIAADDTDPSQPSPVVSSALSSDVPPQWDQTPVKTCQSTSSLTKMLENAYKILKARILNSAINPDNWLVRFLGDATLQPNFALLKPLSPNPMNSYWAIFYMRTMVAAIEQKNHPHLSFLHASLPHSPWHFRPDGSTYIDLFGFIKKETWIDDPYVIRFHQQRHLLQLGLTDVLLGEYLDRLHTISDFDRAIVIVTADHGISFVAGESSHRSLSQAALAGTANVPLFYKEPAQKTSTRHHKTVQLTDIVPTIVSRLGIEPPWALGGHDIFADARPVERSITNTMDHTVSDVPEDLTAMTEATAAEMHRIFGDGASGSLYALGGAHHMIGSQAAKWVTGRSAHCWTVEQPTTTPETFGRLGYGYVYGRMESATDSYVAFALSVDGIVVGTARSFMDGSTHRVYAVGDSQFWRKDMRKVELYEIIDGELASIPACSLRE